MRLNSLLRSVNVSSVGAPESSVGRPQNIVTMPAEIGTFLESLRKVEALERMTAITVEPRGEVQESVTRRAGTGHALGMRRVAVTACLD